MLKLEGSKKTIELIEFLQDKNKSLDPSYVPQPFHKPDKSLLRRWCDFFNPFYHPAELKPCDSLKPSDQEQKAAPSKIPSKHLQSVDNDLE